MTAFVAVASPSSTRRLAVQPPSPLKPSVEANLVFASPLSPHPSRALLARHARREPWPPPPTATAAPRAITLSFPKPRTPARPPPPSDPPKPVRPSQSPPASRRLGTEPRRPPAFRGAPTSGLLLPQRSPGTGSSNPSEAHRPKPATPCPPERRRRRTPSPPATGTRGDAAPDHLLASQGHQQVRDDLLVPLPHLSHAAGASPRREKLRPTSSVPSPSRDPR